MKTIKALAAVLLALAFVMPIQADQYIDNKYENTIVPGLTKRGFRILQTATTPLIREGGSHTYTITPPAGKRVALVAIGDWDTNDVDMFVYGGESGRLITSDTLPDDMPVCEFTSRGGSYRVKITIPDTDAPAYVKFVYAIR